MWNKLERAKLDEQYGCGYTIYGWDGDLLAYESRNNDKSERLTHYFFEPSSFVPVAQAVEQRSIQLLPEPAYEGAYDIDRDPVWQHKPKPVTFSAVAWYQCDHLGTPMELTDEHGDIAWAGVYKAWGLAKEQRSETAKRADIRNPLRFQGQYFDVETGLHYNRYRYYDPQVGRFIGKDPIGFAGGLNVYKYAPNPVGWVDPFGLSACACERDCEKILADAGLEVDTHGNLTKRNKGTQYDSHHIYQDSAVSSVPGYKHRSAVAITLQGRNADGTTRGTPHYNASQTQNNSTAGGLVGSETVIGFKALRSAGVGSQESKCAVMKARGYLSGLGANSGTRTNFPKNRRGR